MNFWDAINNTTLNDVCLFFGYTWKADEWLLTMYLRVFFNHSYGYNKHVDTPTQKNKLKWVTPWTYPIGVGGPWGIFAELQVPLCKWKSKIGWSIINQAAECAKSNYFGRWCWLLTYDVCYLSAVLSHIVITLWCLLCIGVHWNHLYTYVAMALQEPCRFCFSRYIWKKILTKRPTSGQCTIFRWLNAWQVEYPASWLDVFLYGGSPIRFVTFFYLHSLLTKIYQ